MQLQTVLHMFRAYISQRDWSLLEEREIKNGIQLLVKDGSTRITISCYTNGNAFIQGVPGVLKTEVESWWQQQKTSSASPLFVEADLSTSVRTIVEAFRIFAVNQGWSPSGRLIHNGIYQLRLAHENVVVPINVYPTGTVLIQGNSSDMRTVVERWWLQQKSASHASLWGQESQSLEQVSETIMPSQPSQLEKDIVSHIGIGETGKGYYFGPLIIVGIYVNERTVSQLLAAGVSDSKTLSDVHIPLLAQEIKNICRNQGHILAYHPENYNMLYQETSDLSHLLAKAYAQVISNLQKRVASAHVCIDQFDGASLVPSILQEMGSAAILEQRVYESDDIAVAAASIVARAEFMKRIAELSKLVGISLPKGASGSEIVTVGCKIVARGGQEALGKVAKLHFKTTQNIFQR